MSISIFWLCGSVSPYSKFLCSRLGWRPAVEVLSGWCDRLCIRFASNLCVWDLALSSLQSMAMWGFCEYGHVFKPMFRNERSPWPRDALPKYDKQCCHIIEQPGLMHTTDNTTDAACLVGLHIVLLCIEMYLEYRMVQNGDATALQLCFLLPYWGRCTWCNTDSQHYSSSCLELWLDPQTSVLVSLVISSQASSKS